MAAEPPEPNLEDIAWYASNADGTTHPVGSKHPNRWGLSDVLGNVWEWTSQWEFSADMPGPLEDPQTFVPLVAEGVHIRVIRGGCAESQPYLLRAAGSSGAVPGSGDRYAGLGFRLVRTVPTTD
jgi:formylglycine-generating enzyme required for sulfatase activity